MGRSVNKVILLGRAGKDPSVHILRTGTIVNLSLATSERYRTSTATGRNTPMHNLVGFQRSVRSCAITFARDRVCISRRASNALLGRPADRPAPLSLGDRRNGGQPSVASADGGSDDVEHYVSGQASRRLSLPRTGNLAGGGALLERGLKRS